MRTFTFNQAQKNPSTPRHHSSDCSHAPLSTFCAPRPTSEPASLCSSLYALKKKKTRNLLKCILCVRSVGSLQDTDVPLTWALGGCCSSAALFLLPWWGGGWEHLSKIAWLEVFVAASQPWILQENNREGNTTPSLETRNTCQKSLRLYWHLKESPVKWGSFSRPQIHKPPIKSAINSKALKRTRPAVYQYKSQALG